MAAQQLRLAITDTEETRFDGSQREALARLLGSEFDFHRENSSYASHDFHAFPAKFPPQLPRKLILGLTAPGDTVLDPMAGSGTTLVEAYLRGRQAIGVDIDPLAIRLCQVKVTPISVEAAHREGARVLRNSQRAMLKGRPQLEEEIERRFDDRTREFIAYWFARHTQLELMALVREIERVESPDIRRFLELVFSAIIITKSGGVSLARDLAHTRPHRDTTKTPRSALVGFQKRLGRNLASLTHLDGDGHPARLYTADAARLPLADSSVDLVVTSPPYASNAIDYMRAHKFSLVWLGHRIDGLSQLRKRYIGGEATSDFAYTDLPPLAGRVVGQIDSKDEKKAKVLKRYFSEMTRFLAEMFRVAKPGKSVIVVVGSSVMRGVDTLTHECLGEIGQHMGFELVGIAARRLDRDRRMMPARWGERFSSQIEERMHREYLVSFNKP